jgi:type VI secretion system secreted protein Hcp
MAIFLQFGTIKGDGTDSGHVDWIDCQTCTMSITRNINTDIGKGGSREDRLPTVSDFHLTKKWDKASVELWRAAFSKSSGEHAVLHFTKTGTGNLGSTVFLEVEMAKALISHYSMSTSGGEPAESISINATGVQVRHQQFDDNNNPKEAAKTISLQYRENLA